MPKKPVTTENTITVNSSGVVLTTETLGEFRYPQIEHDDALAFEAEFTRLQDGMSFARIQPS